MKLAVAAALSALALIPIGTPASAADGFVTRTVSSNSGYVPAGVSTEEPDDSGPAPSSGPTYSGNGGNSGSTSYSGSRTYSGPTGYSGKGGGCTDCAEPRRHYDTREVIKTQRNVDHSRVINTHSYVYKRPRIVHAAPVVRVPVIKVIEVVVQRYHVVEVPNYTYVPVVYRPAYRPAVHRPVKQCYGGRYGSCTILRVGG